MICCAAYMMKGSRCRTNMQDVKITFCSGGTIKLTLQYLSLLARIPPNHILWKTDIPKSNKLWKGAFPALECSPQLITWLIFNQPERFSICIASFKPHPDWKGFWHTTEQIIFLHLFSSHFRTFYHFTLAHIVARFWISVTAIASKCAMKGQ